MIYLLFALIFILLVSIYFNLKLMHELKTTREKDNYLIKKAYYNPVTELPNEQNLEMVMAEQIYRAKRHKKSFLVAALRITNYHDVHYQSQVVANEFIQEAASRINSSIRDEDLLAHTADNGFIILFNEYLDYDNAQIIFDRLHNIFLTPFTINTKRSIAYEVSIGKVHYPDDATSIESLLHLATRKALSNA